MTPQDGSQSVTCSSCGKRLRAPKLVPGKSYKCPACGGAIRVPEVTERIEMAPPAPPAPGLQATERIEMGPIAASAPTSPPR